MKIVLLLTLFEVEKSIYVYARNIFNKLKTLNIIMFRAIKKFQETSHILSRLKREV